MEPMWLLLFGNMQYQWAYRTMSHHGAYNHREEGGETNLEILYRYHDERY
jgi:hypothetical protein